MDTQKEMIMSRVRNRLAELMQERGLDKKDVAAAAEIGEKTVIRWMKNRVDRYDAPVIDKLCAVLNCTPGELIILED